MAKKKKALGHATGFGNLSNPTKSMVEEQRRLLEQAAKNIDKCKDSEEIIAEQRRLLEEASKNVRKTKPWFATLFSALLSSCCRRRHEIEDHKLQDKSLPQKEAKAEVTEQLNTQSMDSPCSSFVEKRDRVSVPGTPSSTLFALRRIDFCGRQVPILMQSCNGPCSLLAVANCLILQGTMSFRDDEEFVTSDQLVDRLASLGHNLNSKAMVSNQDLAETIRSVVKRLPVLLNGLTVNCRFRTCTDFEYYGDVDLFDIFGLTLYHAWVEPEVANVVSSWNALEERLVACAELRSALAHDDRSATPQEEDLLVQGLWLEQWSEETRTQATSRGLEELRSMMSSKSIGVFFRNNHFSCIYKPMEKPICALLTDVAFQELPSAVWESVELGCAATIYDSAFCPYAPDSDAQLGSIYKDNSKHSKNQPKRRS